MPKILFYTKILCFDPCVKNYQKWIAFLDINGKLYEYHAFLFTTNKGYKQIFIHNLFAALDEYKNTGVIPDRVFEIKSRTQLQIRKEKNYPKIDEVLEKYGIEN